MTIPPPMPAQERAFLRQKNGTAYLPLHFDFAALRLWDDAVGRMTEQDA